MSGINIEYNCEHKIGNGTSQMHCEGIGVLPNSNLATIIAGEIVNEILENALDIVTRMGEKGIEQKLIKDAKTYEVRREENLNVNNMCAKIIENIVDDVSKQPTPTIKDLLDGLDNIDICKSCDLKKAEQPLTLEKEIKRLLEDMKAPPCDIVIYDKSPIKGGVGDQPFKNVGDTTVTAESVALNPKVSVDAPVTVEKKLRVTDLVRNSRQLLSEFIGTDEKLKHKQEKFEESEEQFLQVIELDCVKPGEVPFKALKKVPPEEVPLPDDDDDEIIKVPEDKTMDVIDLSPKAFEEEEKNITSENENVHNGKGDDNDCITPASTTQVQSDECEKIPSPPPKLSDVKISGESEPKGKKKKWNFGGRLLGFLKKHPKQRPPNPDNSHQK